MEPTILATVPPLLMVKLLLLPLLPTVMLVAKLCVPPLAMKVAPLPVSPIVKSAPLFTVVPAEMMVPPLKVITLLVLLVASKFATVTVPPVTLSVPEPALPMSIWPLVTVRLPPLMLTKLFEDLANALMTKSVPTMTSPPSLRTRLLPSAKLPMVRPALLSQSEFAPVTSTLLLKELPKARPIVPVVFRTVPPLEMTRLLPAPFTPTLRSMLVHSESVPVTSTMLLEAPGAEPMTPADAATRPPLEMTMLLPLPPKPTRSSALLVSKVPGLRTLSVLLLSVKPKPT